MGCNFEKDNDIKYSYMMQPDLRIYQDLSAMINDFSTIRGTVTRRDKVGPHDWHLINLNV